MADVRTVLQNNVDLQDANRRLREQLQATQDAARVAVGALDEFGHQHRARAIVTELERRIEAIR